MVGRVEPRPKPCVFRRVVSARRLLERAERLLTRYGHGPVMSALKSIERIQPSSTVWYTDRPFVVSVSSSPTPSQRGGLRKPVKGRGVGGGSEPPPLARRARGGGCLAVLAAASQKGRIYP
jgi:hypothetical protein